MIDAIKSSFAYSVIRWIADKLNDFASVLHKHIHKEGKKSILEYLESSWFYKLTLKVVDFINSIFEIFYRAGEKSFLLKNGSVFRKILNMAESIVLLIPINYIFIDYVVRRVGALSKVASVWDELALVGCFLFIIVRPFFSDKNYKIVWSAVDWLISLFIVVGVALFLYVSPDLYVGVEGFRAVFQHMFWYFIIRQLLNQNNRVAVLRSIVIIGLFLGYHSMYQFVMRVPMPGNWVDSTETITVRVFSIIGSPNILAALFVLIIPIVGMMIAYDKSKLIKFLALVALPAMILGMLFTFARQAYISLFASVLGFLVLFYPYIIKYLIVFVGMVLVALPSVADRVFYLFSKTYLVKSSKGGRILRYLYAFEKWEEAPFFGKGLGRFGGAVAINNDLSPFYVDSYYIKTLVEMGLVGLISMISLIIAIMVYARSVIIKQLDKMDMLMVSGLFMGFLGIVLQNTIENIFEVPMMIIMFWTVVALIQTFDAKKSNGHLSKEKL